MRNVVVAGGSSGIGKALVDLFSSKGDKVYSLDKDLPESPANGVEYVQVDLTNTQQTQDCLVKITPPIQILILSIGVMRRGTIFDSTEADYDLLMDTNLKAPWLLLKFIRPLLANSCSIVQISSGHALNPVANPGIYTLSKKGTATLAGLVSLASPDYRVKIVYPGPVLTPLLLAGRDEADRDRIKKIAGKPEDLALKINRLVDSDKTSLKFNPSTQGYDLV